MVIGSSGSVIMIGFIAIGLQFLLIVYVKFVEGSKMSLT